MVSRPPRFVVFVGDIRKLARDLAGLEDLELFGSTGQTGRGELRCVSAALRAGAVQQVCFVIRWAGHGEIDAIRKLCAPSAWPAAASTASAPSAAGCAATSP